MLMSFASCKKSDYLTDGGLSERKSQLSTYDYLKQHKYHLFDTLVMVIDHYNLKEEINSAPTFFAATNYSINRYLRLKQDSLRLFDENARYLLADMYKDINADSIRMYLPKSKVELMSTSLEPTIIANPTNTVTAVQRILQSKPDPSWSSAPIYYLYYIKVRGTLDPSIPPGTSTPNDPDIDLKSQCQTTDIEPSSGGMLHVLSNRHIFIRF